MTRIYQEKLRLVPKTERDQRMERIPLERFEWPLGLAIACCCWSFSSWTVAGRRRSGPCRRRRGGTGSFHRPRRFLRWDSSGFPCLSRAAEVVSANQDPRKIYNEGTEAYSKGDFAKVSESLRSSLRTQDLALQQRSYYNLGNTLYRTGQGTLGKGP